MPTNEVSWLVELVVKPAQLDSFRSLTREMIEVSRQELGVLNYERFISADGSVVYAYERYADSDAAVAHLQMFQKTFNSRFIEMVDRRRFTVFGVPSDELKKILDRFGPTYARQFG